MNLNTQKEVMRAARPSLFQKKTPIITLHTMAQSNTTLFKFKTLSESIFHNLHAFPSRESTNRMRLGTQEMLGVLEVKGEATEASSSDREMPPWALFKAWGDKVRKKIKSSTSEADWTNGSFKSLCFTYLKPPLACYFGWIVLHPGWMEIQVYKLYLMSPRILWNHIYCRARVDGTYPTVVCSVSTHTNIVAVRKIIRSWL